MYVDADLFYALIKKGDRHAIFAKHVLSKQERKYTSIITLLELEILIKREINDELSKEVLELFKKEFPKVKIENLNEKTFDKSTELRKKFDLGIFDSIHAATALLKDKKIASTDNIFDRITGLKRISKPVEKSSL